MDSSNNLLQFSAAFLKPYPCQSNSADRTKPSEVSERLQSYHGMTVETADLPHLFTNTQSNQIHQGNGTLDRLDEYAIAALTLDEPEDISGTDCPVRPPSGDKERTVSDAINHIDFYSMVEAELRARQQQACQTEASQVAETVGAEPIKWANKRNELLEQLNVVRRNGADDKTVADLFTEVLAAGHLARRQAQLEEIKACMDSGYVTREHYHRSQQAFTAELERVFRRESAEPDYQELLRERAKYCQQIYRKPDIIG